MKRSLKALTGLLLVLLLSAGFAGCGVKFDNVKQIEAKYLITDELGQASDIIYPNKPNAIQLEQVYTKWIITPEPGITVRSLSFSVKFLNASAESLASPGFSVQIAASYYDAAAGKVATYEGASQSVSADGELVVFQLPDITFPKDTPKASRKDNNLVVSFLEGGAENGSIKLTLTDLVLGTKD